METIFNIIVLAVIFTASLFGLHSAELSETNKDTLSSVEFGLSEMSPRGEEGGFAMPASGCSAVTNPATHNPAIPVHDCGTLPTITALPAIVRYGVDVVVTWNPQVVGRTCTLSTTVMELVGAPNPAAAPIAGATGSRIDRPTSMRTYRITCEQGKYAEATVKVLPRIQET